MSADTPKKMNSVLGKLGQRFNTIREDIADNIERRKQLYNTVVNNQVHFTNRADASEHSLVIEKRPPTPPETNQRHASGSDESSMLERPFSLAQFASNLGKKTSNESSSGSGPSHSSFDIFSSENSEQAKDMIMNNIRQEMKRHRARAVSESSSDDFGVIKPDRSPPAPARLERSKPKSTMLLTGPKFQYHTSQSTSDLKRDTIYPISFAVGILSIIIILWKPISPLISGYILGFLTAAAIAYVIIRMYLTAKVDRFLDHQWMNFPELESVTHENEILKNVHTCCEVVFGRYDADQDGKFLRYPAVIHLDHQRLIVQLPAKTKSDEKKEIVFVGFREYLVTEAKLILVPEMTMNRKKYWLNEYPIVVQNTQMSNKQILNKQFYEKAKFDTEEFFNNPETTISLFFETGPDKEEWFYRLSLAIGKTTEETPLRSPSSSHPIVHSMSDTQISLASRPTPEHRVQTISPSSTDTTSNDKNETDADILSGAQDTRPDESSEGAHRTGSMKKKARKQQQEETLERLFSSPDCLDEAAITLNFLTRRLFCDVFEEPLFKALLKEKFELKLKEIAVSVLDDLRVENIDMGNTFPVILKVESMQWNDKGIWFNLFLFYRGSFKITIKTRIILQRLLHYKPLSEQPIHYQHQTSQIVRKDEELNEHDERSKSSSKEPELPENAAARRIGALLSKVAANPHVQRFAALKPVADAIEKLSNAEIGANIELTNLSGIMTINIPPPPSDRIWIGFAEMPELNFKVTPVFGESKYSYALIHDFLEARIREEIKRLLVLPSMDDQLLPFFRDWVTDLYQSNSEK